MKKHILFVDDEQVALDSLRRMLRKASGLWQMSYLDDPVQAWERLLGSGFDVLVTDVCMPGMSGLELLERMQHTPRTKDVPVVMVTGLLDRALKREALDMGAIDLLNKPVEPGDLAARLRSVLRLKSYQDELRAWNELFDEQVQDKTEELSHSRLEVIWRLGRAAEQRDDETGNHVIRVASYSRAIAEALGMPYWFVETLFLAAPLHDIGKIGVPDRILFKRGPLGPGQSAVMKEHCAIGARILRGDGKVRAAFREWRGTTSRYEIEGLQNRFLEMAASIALTHHEKWDGTGYPQGLAGEMIPVESRIVAISDVFDAMTSPRCYRSACREERALAILRDAVGTHFDPEVYTAFLQALPEIRSIRGRFADPDEPSSDPRELEYEEVPVRR